MEIGDFFFRLLFSLVLLSLLSFLLIESSCYMCIVEAQVKRAVRRMNPLGGDEGRGWRSGGSWKRWGGTYCESQWHEAK